MSNAYRNPMVVHGKIPLFFPLKYLIYLLVFLIHLGKGKDPINKLDTYYIWPSGIHLDIQLLGASADDLSYSLDAREKVNESSDDCQVKFL